MSLKKKKYPVIIASREPWRYGQPNRKEWLVFKFDKKGCAVTMLADKSVLWFRRLSRNSVLKKKDYLTSLSSFAPTLSNWYLSFSLISNANMFMVKISVLNPETV